MEFLCDSHFHIGQFHEINCSPIDVAAFVKDLGINKIAISSTSACIEDYKKIEEEHLEVEKLLQERVFSLMWLTPQMIETNNLEKLLNSGVNWKGLKIHGLQHKWNKNLFKKIIGIAQHYSFPIKLHTGGCSESDAGSYKELIKSFKNQTFILAHGRPIEQAVDILKDCPNAFVDTAFMPVENIQLLVISGYANRVLFGSDYPAFKYYYPEIKCNTYYKKLILELEENVEEIDFKRITFDNFNLLYKS